MGCHQEKEGKKEHRLRQGMDGPNTTCTRAKVELVLVLQT